jgi:hypothetical protein
MGLLRCKNMHYDVGNTQDRIGLKAKNHCHVVLDKISLLM